MSCPSCQVAGRRLPPFPLSYVNKSQNRLTKGLDTLEVNDSALPLKPLRSEKDFTMSKMQTGNEINCKIFFLLDFVIYLYSYRKYLFKFSLSSIIINIIM